MFLAIKNSKQNKFQIVAPKIDFQSQLNITLEYLANNNLSVVAIAWIINFSIEQLFAIVLHKLNLKIIQKIEALINIYCTLNILFVLLAQSFYTLEKFILLNTNQLLLSKNRYSIEKKQYISISLLNLLQSIVEELERNTNIAKYYIDYKALIDAT